MANTFKNFKSKNVGTSAATIYTCPSATQTTIIGLSLANTSASPITTDVYITSGGTDFFLIKSGVVPVGGTLVIVGGEQKVVLEAADVLKALTSAASSADVVCSLLEIT
jgi:hypothetical protein